MKKGRVRVKFSVSLLEGFLDIPPMSIVRVSHPPGQEDTVIELTLEGEEWATVPGARNFGFLPPLINLSYMDVNQGRPTRIKGRTF